MIRLKPRFILSELLFGDTEPTGMIDQILNTIRHRSFNSPAGTAPTAKSSNP